MKLVEGFTSKYNINRLVYYEETTDINQAIQMEKKIKGFTRDKKNALVESKNPGWIDLSEKWYK